MLLKLNSEFRKQFALSLVGFRMLGRMRKDGEILRQIGRVQRCLFC